jgi:hypothetical protein
MPLENPSAKSAFDLNKVQFRKDSEKTPTFALNDLKK